MSILSDDYELGKSPAISSSRPPSLALPTPNDLRTIMQHEPQLTIEGFGIWSGHRRKSKREQEAIFAEKRQRLWGGIERIQPTCEWIEENLEPAHRFNSRWGSYTLKHLAEREVDYITNGQFIASMLLMGYRVRRDRWIGWFNYSVRKEKLGNGKVFVPPTSEFVTWWERTAGGLQPDYGPWIEVKPARRSG